MESIFATLSLDRSVVAWEDHIGDETPWELRGGIWFKRDDYFAPIGGGGPNGSKLRQLIWYFSQYKQGKTHVLSGASVQSPQLGHSALVAAHFGLPAKMIVYSKPRTVLTHEQPYIAYRLGAEFVYAKGPYNPILQRTVSDMAGPASLVVEYGITLPHDKYPVWEVGAFHEVGSWQVANMPDGVESLIVPAGSCNTLVSVVMGLVRQPKNLRTLYTLGIGPDKLWWAHERLALIGVDVGRLPFAWMHHSLHGGYAKYTDHFEGESYYGVNFHPTYEAKMWRWMNVSGWLECFDVQRKPGALGFWIVGGPSNIDSIQSFFVRDVPAGVNCV